MNLGLETQSLSLVGVVLCCGGGVMRVLLCCCEAVMQVFWGMLLKLLCRNVAGVCCAGSGIR